MISKSLRKKLLERADGVCEECGCAPDWRGGLQIHHIKHKGMGGSKSLDVESNLTALCPRCHALVHGIVER